MTPRILLVGLLCIAPAAAFASPQVSIGVTIGRPAPIVIREAPPHRVVSDARPRSPGPGYIWADGHHSWRKSRWVWVPGAWIRPVRPGAVWIPPSWDPPSESWTEGYWEIAQPTTPAPPVVMAAPAGTTIIVAAPPPPPRREYRAPRPGRGYVWVSGYWTHRHGRHAWVPGYWTKPPRGHRHWVEPRWDRRGRNYVFIEGRWK